MGFNYVWASWNSAIQWLNLTRPAQTVLQPAPLCSCVFMPSAEQSSQLMTQQSDPQTADPAREQVCPDLVLLQLHNTRKSFEKTIKENRDQIAWLITAYTMILFWPLSKCCYEETLFWPVKLCDYNTAVWGCAKSPIIKDALCERVSADVLFFFFSCTRSHHTCTETHAHMLSEAHVRGSVTVRWRRPFIVASNFLPFYFEMVNLWTVHAAHVCHFGALLFFFFFFFVVTTFFFLPHFQS